MASTRLGYLAVKRQTTDNVAVIPSHFLRFKEGDMMLKQEVIMNDPIQNNRWKSLQAIPGKINCEGNYKFDLDANECVHWIAGGLGTLTSSTDISSATDASVFLHTVDFGNTLPIFSVEQGKGNLTDTSNNRQNYSVERSYGSYVDSFKLSANDKLVGFEVKLKALGIRQKASVINALTASGSPVVISVDSAEGFVTGETVNIEDGTPQNETKVPSALSLTAIPNTITVPTLTNSYTIANLPKVELTPQTPSFSIAPQVFSFVHVNFQFGADLTAAASAAESNIENWEFEFMNHLEERFGNIRSSPGVIAPKGAEAKFKFTKYFANVADRDKYLSIVRQACIITIANNVIVSATDTGNKKYQVQFKLNDLRFKSYEMPTGTDALYAVKVEAECLYNSTDGKAIQALVQNASVGTVYTA